MFSTRLYSSLVKVMQQSTPTDGIPFQSATVLRGEVLSFQVSYYTDKQDEIARLFYREINHDRV